MPNTFEKSLLIALVASILDQAYHLFASLPHSIQTISSIETITYISIKFMTVFLVSMFIFSQNHIRAYWSNIVAVSAVSAGIFGFILTKLFPYSYDAMIHLIHYIAVFLAILITDNFLYKRRRK